MSDLHQPVLASRFFAYLEKSVGMPVSIYVREIPDSMVDGLLVDYDDEYVFIKTDYSMDAWLIKDLSGISIFTDADDETPKFEITFGKK